MMSARARALLALPRAGLVAAACMMVLVTVAACDSLASPPEGPDVVDRYGNAIPIGEAWDAMSLSAQQILADETWGLDANQKCVGLDINWAPSSSNAKPQGLEPRLAHAVAVRVANATGMEVHLVNEATAKNACPQKRLTQLVTFEPLILWEGELRVRAHERCVGDCWGGAVWEYRFTRDGSEWILAEKRTLGVS